jgi:hypothetical protein
MAQSPLVRRKSASRRASGQFSHLIACTGHESHAGLNVQRGLLRQRAWQAGSHPLRTQKAVLFYSFFGRARSFYRTGEPLSFPRGFARGERWALGGCGWVANGRTLRAELLSKLRPRDARTRRPLVQCATGSGTRPHLAGWGRPINLRNGRGDVGEAAALLELHDLAAAAVRLRPRPGLSVWAVWGSWVSGTHIWSLLPWSVGDKGPVPHIHRSP